MSDIVKILPYTVNLDDPVEKTELHTLFVMGDSKAHRFEIAVTQGGAALDLTGCTVTGYFINFKEKIRVKIDGKAENGKAAVTLIRPCYAIHGHFTMIIQIISGDVEHSVFCGDGYMRASETEAIIYDDYIIYDVAALLAQISEMKTATEAANKAAAAAENPPYIDAGNNHWMVWDKGTDKYTDTGVTATGPQGRPGTSGDDGVTPHIGENGNWWIGNTDTGTKAQGPAGANGTGSGTVTGVMIGDQTYTPNESGVVELPEQGGTGVPDGGTTGQILIKQSDANGDAIWKTPTAEDVGARPSTWMPSASDVGARPSTWMPSASDVGARPSTWTPSASDVGALPSNGTAVNASKLGNKAPQYYTPYTNHADNSDFTRLVAQKGVGGKHGTQTYAGDRWMLVSGTVTGTANTDGDGYSDITLNGTIVQVVPSPPAAATPFIEMVSGEAEISYDATVSEIIITSAGGVIKNVVLLEGSWTEKPEYVAKGYAAELAVCQRYFITGVGAHTVGHGGVIDSKLFFINIPTPATMCRNPVCIIDVADNVIFGATYGYAICNVIGVGGVIARANSVFIDLNLNTELPQHYAAGSTFGTSLTLVADLPRR